MALLGGINAWLRIPPWASALYLGLAVVLFVALAKQAVDVLAPTALAAVAR